METHISKRNSKIEALRIVSMIGIVFHHYVQYSIPDEMKNIALNESLWLRIINGGGKIGVNIFVLISGYYLILNNNGKKAYSKLVVQWLQLITYANVIYYFCILTGIQGFEIKWLIKSFIPVSVELWWFASTYFILYLLHPYINMLVNSMDKREYQKLILILIVMWSVLPTILHVGYQSNNLLWFITVYLIACYIRLYVDLNQYRTKWFIICTMGAITFSVMTKLYNQEHFNTLVAAVSIFIVFLKLKNSSNKFVNFISSCTFGVYLIHDHPLLRRWVWGLSFPNFVVGKIQSGYYIILDSLSKTVCIFLVCICVSALLNKIVYIELIVVNFIRSIVVDLHVRRD